MRRGRGSRVWGLRGLRVYGCRGLTGVWGFKEFGGLGIWMIKGFRN
jgi:hypothetical protein